MSPTHIPTAINTIPAILPAIFALLYPKKAMVSGVVNGSKKTTIPIIITPIPTIKTLFVNALTAMTNSPKTIPPAKYLILCSSFSFSSL